MVEIPMWLAVPLLVNLVISFVANVYNITSTVEVYDPKYNQSVNILTAFIVGVFCIINGVSAVYLVIGMLT